MSRPRESTNPEGVRALWLAGQSAWPAIRVPLDPFAWYLARHARDGALPGPERAGDLYVVCACAERVPAAIDAFERLLATAVARGASRMDPSRAFADLVAQDLRTRLLMGDPPNMTDYAGRASLATWLKTAAVRAALNLRRGKAEQAHESVSAAVVAGSGPDVALIREKYRGAFEDALRTALAALPEQQRMILSLSVRDGMNTDQLAEKLKVGRSTAARWLVAAREMLTRETRRVLTERLGLTDSELDSVAAEVRSEVHVSIHRLLARR